MLFRSPTDARFFAFNLTEHTFEWWRKNDTYSDTMDEDEVVIKDIADISNLLEFVYLNCEKLRDKDDLAKAFAKLFADPEPKPKKKRKKDDGSAAKISVAKIKQAADYIAKHTKPTFNPMMFIEEMSQPKASVFYKDLAKDFTQEQYDKYYEKALYATSEAELAVLYSKINGLHGPLATKLGNFINQKIKNLKYPPKSSWAVKEEQKYWYSQHEKLHSEMADELAKEIDKEILAKMMMQYEKYAQEKQKQQTWFAYEKAAKSKSWGGWANGMYDHVIVKSPPYNMVDSMDY